MKPPPIVVGIGEALWDTFAEGSYFGGAPGNFAVHVAALVGPSFLISSLGKDERGLNARQLLNERGVDLTHVQTHPTRATGEVNIILNEQAVPEFHFMADPAWDDLVSTPAQLELAASCHAVNFGTLGQQSPGSRKTTQNFLRACPPESIRLFDLNLRRDFWSPELILESLELASALKCNEDEVKVLADIIGLVGSAPEVVIRKVLKRFQLKFVALTLGKEGSLLVTPDLEDWLQPEAAKAIDTTGAGDSFVATLIVGMLAGIPLPELHRHAGRIASYVCSQQGATPALPAKLTAFLSP